MIDTIKLRLPSNAFEFMRSIDASISLGFLPYNMPSYVKVYSTSYMPTVYFMKYYDYVNKKDTECIYIVFSIPKLLYGHNLYEVSECDFGEVIKELEGILDRDFRLRIKDKESLINADISEIHYSKNVILKHHDVPTVLEVLKNGKIKRLKTRYRDYFNGGEQLSFYAEQYEVTMYDKKREIIQSATKLKQYGEMMRAHYDAFLKVKHRNIFRIEVRLKTKGKIKDMLKRVGIIKKADDYYPVTFKKLFNMEIAKRTCEFFYNEIAYSVATPIKDELFYITENIFNNHNLLTGKAFANIGVAFCLHHFGKNKTLLRSPKKVREVEQYISDLKRKDHLYHPALQEISDALYHFIPIYSLSNSPEEDNDEITYRPVKEMSPEDRAKRDEEINEAILRNKTTKKEFELLTANSEGKTWKDLLEDYYVYEGKEKERKLEEQYSAYIAGCKYFKLEPNPSVSSKMQQSIIKMKKQDLAKKAAAKKLKEDAKYDFDDETGLLYQKVYREPQTHLLQRKRRNGYEEEESCYEEGGCYQEEEMG